MYGTRTYLQKRFIAFRPMVALFIGFVVLILSGCVANETPVANSTNSQPAPPTNTVNSNANQTTTEQTQTEAARVPITLPVVDALFADEQFVTEVRRVVQPTDEQFDRL